MDFHLDTLLNLPGLTVESGTQEAGQAFLRLRFLNETGSCPHCQNRSEQLHQNRPVLLRDLPISGHAVYLHVPRRQFYCSVCQRYFTESGIPPLGNCPINSGNGTNVVELFSGLPEGGMAQLKALTFYRPQSELKQHQESLEAYFRAHPPQTLAQATAKIEERTGIVRSREQVRHFLKAMGMNCRRVGVWPAKADPDAQEAFLKKTRTSVGGGKSR